MKIGYVSYEVSPFAKVGGLADVAGSLPKYLNKIGEDIYIIMPYHKIVDKNIDKSQIQFVEKNFFPISHNFKKSFDVYKTHIPNSKIVVYLIKNDDLFSTESIYSDLDEGLQSSYFSDAALKTIKELEPDTQIINVNDWQTALIPVYLKINYSEDEILSSMGIVITIHNLGYQGVFNYEKINESGLPAFLYNIDALEFFGNVNYLKGGILFSDVINTVSKTYAEEIQTDEYGHKLDGVLNIRSDNLYGIINGIDYDLYNPINGKNIYHPIKSYDDKIKNKLSLQKDLGLPENKNVPVLSFIGRLVDQKGLDLLKEIVEYIMLNDINFVFLGTGDKKYEDYFKDLQNKYPKKVYSKIGFDLDLADKIYVGSDIFLMPSLYEPCGLGQMYAMRYGTVPIVRYTGGLEDTVSEYYENTKTGTGFGFYDYEDCRLLKSILKALTFYFNKKDHWINIFNNCMKQDFSYENTANQYKELYKIAYNQKKR